MSPAITLSHRVAIVTGGRRQLGAAQAIRLAECGADVCLADLDHDDGMTATAAAIERLGRRALTVVCDVRRRDQVERMVETCAAELGGVDILVNNAGISSRETLMEVTDGEWDAVFDTNLKGMVLCTQYAARAMIAQGRGGAIVNLSSSTGLNANVSRGPYSVSKAGVIMATRLLARELGEHDIRVNAIAPGIYLHREDRRPRRHHVPSRPGRDGAGVRPLGPQAAGRAGGLRQPGRVPRLRSRGLHHGNDDSRRRRIHHSLMPRSTAPCGDRAA